MDSTSRIMFRFSYSTAILIAVYCCIWHLITGHMPVIDSIQITNNWAIKFPFAISRWWDILIGPVWSVILVLILNTGEFGIRVEKMPIMIQVSMLFWFLVAMVIEFTTLVVTTLIFGPAIGLILVITIGIVICFLPGSNLCPLISLSLGLVVSMWLELIFGLFVFIIFGAFYIIGKIFGIIHQKQIPSDGAHQRSAS